jgi:DNA-binding transcriptional LysR family regulator
MDLAGLQVFLAVAAERSFSKAAGRMHRTQSAISQALRRLEDELGERLTDAGRVLHEYAERLMRLAGEAESAIHELRDLQRGRVLVGANEGTVPSLLPLIVRFQRSHPAVHVDVRRIHARQIGAEVATGGLDFGIVTFQPAEAGLGTVIVDRDDLVLLVPPTHPFAKRRVVHMDDVGRQPVVAHNDPSPTRDQVIRTYQRRREALNIRVSLPSLDAVKRAVESGLGVAVLPRRCAVSELERGDLVAIRVPELHRKRQLRLVYRRTGTHSHAATAFLNIVQEVAVHER